MRKVGSAILLAAFTILLPALAPSNASDSDVLTLMARSTEGRQLFLSWAKPTIEYSVSGDLEGMVTSQVDDLLESIGKAAKLETKKRTPSRIILVFDSTIFDQVRGDRSRLHSTGIPNALLDYVDQQIKADPNIGCFAKKFADESDTVQAGLVLSKTATPDCVRQSVFSVFGVAHESDTAQGLLATCVLYAARRAGLRTELEIRPQLGILMRQCADVTS